MAARVQACVSAPLPPPLPPPPAPFGCGRKRCSGKSFSGLMNSLSPALKEVAAIPPAGFTLKYNSWMVPNISSTCAQHEGQWAWGRVPGSRNGVGSARHRHLANVALVFQVDGRVEVRHLQSGEAHE